MKAFFDENFPPALAKGLDCFQQGSKSEGFEVCHVVTTFNRGIADEEWIPKVAQMHGVAITQDLRIQRTQHLNQLCQDNKLGVFFFKPPKKSPYKYWDMIKWVMHNWADIKELAGKTTKPFAYVIPPKGGIKRLH